MQAWREKAWGISVSLLAGCGGSTSQHGTPASETSDVGGSSGTALTSSTSNAVGGSGQGGTGAAAGAGGATAEGGTGAAGAGALGSGGEAAVAGTGAGGGQGTGGGGAEGGTTSTAGAGGDGGTGTPGDPSDCGPSGMDCTTLPYVDPHGVGCVDGECTYGDGACLPGFAHCTDDPEAGCSEDLSRVGNCGNCSTQCNGGLWRCASPASGPYECVGECPDDLVECDNQCVDLESNARHCGACSEACSVPNGVSLCVDGECEPAGCFAGYADCFPGQLGCETFLDTFDHCARCGDTCRAANATSHCNGGVCEHECKAGFADCDSESPDCETRLDDGENCGDCGVTCPDDQPLCEQGSCVATCEPPFLDECQGSCVNFENDPLNCGSCGYACETYQGCEAGLCTPTYLGTAIIESPDYSPTYIAMHSDGSFAVSYRLSGSVDLDPGSSSAIVTSNGGADVAVIKFTAGGDFEWARAVGGADSDWGGQIAFGPDGTLVQSVDFRGTVDFDPGDAVVSRTALGTVENALVKLALDGSFVWLSNFATTADATTERGALTVDSTGAVYASGHYVGEVDLDPGAETHIETSSQRTGHLVKLNDDGSFVWAITFPDCDLTLVDLAVDDGVLWASGGFTGTCDADPGQGVVERTALGNSDSIVLQLDASTGAYLDSHVESLATYENVVSSAFDSDGSRYFGMGSSSGGIEVVSYLLKTDSSLVPEWNEATQNANAFDIALAPLGGVVAAGSGRRTTGPYSDGVFLTRQGPNGERIWTIELESRNSAAHDIASSSSGFVVVGDISEYGIDFDPGPGTDAFDAHGTFISRYAF